MKLVTVVNVSMSPTKKAIIKAFKIKNGLIPTIDTKNLIPVYKSLLSLKDISFKKGIDICQELPYGIACQCVGWDCIDCAFSNRNVKTKRDYFNVVKTLKRIHSYYSHKFGNTD